MRFLGDAQGFDSGQEGATAPDSTYTGPGLPTPAWGSNAFTTPVPVGPTKIVTLSLPSAASQALDNQAAVAATPMSTGEKVAIGIGIAGVVGLGIWFIAK